MRDDLTHTTSQMPIRKIQMRSRVVWRKSAHRYLERHRNSVNWNTAEGHWNNASDSTPDQYQSILATKHRAWEFQTESSQIGNENCDQKVTAYPRGSKLIELSIRRMERFIQKLAFQWRVEAHCGDSFEYLYQQNGRRNMTDCIWRREL